MANREHKRPQIAGKFEVPQKFRRPYLGRRKHWQFWRWEEMGDQFGVSLTRLTVLRTPWFMLCVHWHRRPEIVAQLHTHWSWLLAFVVRGGYLEQREDGVHMRRRFRFNFIPRGVFHRIALVKERTLTVVLTGGVKDPVEFKRIPEWDLVKK